ncbi:hypothetical protein EUA06_14910 [Nocardioides glacieisoli]|uniref:2'-5' RNA ligase family protein n=1 Tax=Nocardioides glacieisoli TaxID=1168730 RepID=A0A4Q2RQ98_9ACTN|nr:hypothetical protein [Nocardioides glacieisoli]RYB89869.1 hypothetical protein EUA06_14910 [Nocardioides glacieisoli]
MPAANPVFDRLFDDAVPALLGGSHRRDEPPVDGGRWPVSIVAVPGSEASGVLADLMDDALVHAGPGHFETGRSDASHLTVRALEPYREAASATDDITGQWVAALDEVGRASAPVTLRFTGVTLTVSGVMVQAEPVDDGPWELMRRLRTALGPLAWFEDQWQERDIWYSSILHFAAPVLDPAGLVGWAEQNRASLALDVTLDSLVLTRFRYREVDGRRHMAMEPWHAAALAG